MFEALEILGLKATQKHHTYKDSEHGLSQAGTQGKRRAARFQVKFWNSTKGRNEVGWDICSTQAFVGCWRCPVVTVFHCYSCLCFGLLTYATHGMEKAHLTLWQNTGSGCGAVCGRRWGRRLKSGDRKCPFTGLEMPVFLEWLGGTAPQWLPPQAAASK